MFIMCRASLRQQSSARTRGHSVCKCSHSRRCNSSHFDFCVWEFGRVLKDGEDITSRFAFSNADLDITRLFLALESDETIFAQGGFPFRMGGEHWQVLRS